MKPLVDDKWGNTGIGFLVPCPNEWYLNNVFSLGYDAEFRPINPAKIITQSGKSQTNSVKESQWYVGHNREIVVLNAWNPTSLRVNTREDHLITGRLHVEVRTWTYDSMNPSRKLCTLYLLDLKIEGRRYIDEDHLSYALLCPGQFHTTSKYLKPKLYLCTRIRITWTCAKDLMRYEHRIISRTLCCWSHYGIRVSYRSRRSLCRLLLPPD